MNDKVLYRRRYSSALIIIGIMILLYPLLTEAYGAYAQYRLKTKWDEEIARQEKSAVQAESRQVSLISSETISNENAVLTKVLASENGDRSVTPFPPTKIKLPKLGVEQVIVEGVDTDVLKNGPGHYPGTANPGQPGNIGIAGHRVTYTQPFNRLDELAPGDEVILETLQYIYTYRVDYSKVLDPNDTSMLRPTGTAQLTLTTCTPKYSATSRLDVRAVLVKAAPRQKPTILRRLIASFTPPEPEKTPRNAFEMALSEARDAINKNPRDVEAHVSLGAVYQAQRQFKKAEAEYNEAVGLDPLAARPHYQLGLLYEQTSKTQRAIEELNRAITLDPKYEAAMFRLGNIYLKNKSYDQAVALLQNGVEISPYSSDIHYHLALAYEKLGNKDLAIVHYQQALKFVPDYFEAKEGLKRVLEQ